MQSRETAWSDGQQGLMERDSVGTSGYEMDLMIMIMMMMMIPNIDTM